MSEEIKQAILDFMEKSSQKGKKKLYAKDISKGLSDRFENKEVKKMVQALLDSGDLCYWSSGSTTYVMLKNDWVEQQAKETQ